MEIAKTTEGQQWDRKEDFFSVPISLKKKLTPETLNMLDISPMINKMMQRSEKWIYNIFSIQW